MNDIPFKILSIDGGGIKGLYSAKILEMFEVSIQTKHQDTNLRIVDFFDLICGTSTGGLIALAASLRIPMSKVCEFYEMHGPKIFPKPNSFYRRYIKQTFFNGKYDDKYLKKALYDFFGERNIGESECLLCIPSYNFTHGTYALFKYDHIEGDLKLHNKLKIVDVALSTTAAPTYFPIAQIKDDHDNQFIDGGVWANNPSLVGFMEGIKYFVGENKVYQKMQLLSISSLNAQAGAVPLQKRSRAFVNWSDALFDVSLIGQSEFSDNFLKTMVAQTHFPIDYIRIPSAAISGNQVKYITLDNASPQSIALMKQFADAMYNRFRNHETVKRMFSSRKSYAVKK